jgi:hypothetical protein
LLGRRLFFIGSILFQSNGDNAKALVYVNKALTWQKKPFWYNRLKSLIQAKLEIKKAIRNIITQQLRLQNQDYVKWIKTVCRVGKKLILYLNTKSRFDTISRRIFYLFSILAMICRSYSISTDLGNDKFNRRFADFLFWIRSIVCLINHHWFPD